MKRKLTVLVCGLILLGAQVQSQASTANPGEVVIDAAVVRPLCFVSTIVGSALFVVTLPVAALSHSVRSTEEALVLKPARATFTRPLGDLEDLGD
jgi:hypothetical protein